METGQETKLRLYWGPGPGPEGWLRLAGPEGAAPDLTCDIVLDGLPFASESIERALCRFAPQTLGAHDLLQALREIRRVLEPGGRLRLEYRDLDKAIGAYQAGARERFWATEWSPAGKLSDIGNDFSRFTRKQQPWMAARDDSAYHYAVVKIGAKRELSFEAFAVPPGDAPARRIDAFTIQGA